ncbi:hypothetical protein K438DRAFT_1631437, partial [Mycena galopus ATCC 62051]
CKSNGKGITRYQTNKDGTKAADRSSTSNLMKHAKKCWGADVVKARMKGVEAQGKDGSIFSAFANASARPVAPSDHREFRHILGAGRPEYRLPSRRIVARDLRAAYDHSRIVIATLLRDYPGRLSFGTDAWTSPNHRGFLAWTVHLQHEGELLSFPLDVFEVPEVRYKFINISQLSDIVSVTYRGDSCPRVRRNAC